MANINKGQAAVVLKQNHMRKPSMPNETWTGILPPFTILLL